MDKELADQRRQHLGALVKADRGRKFRTVDAARIAAGISRGTWDAVERGDSAKDFTYAAIEEALGWYAGRSRAILAGDDDPVSPFGREQLEFAREQREREGGGPPLSNRVKQRMREIMEERIGADMEQAQRVAVSIQDSDPENAARILAEATFVAEQLRRVVADVTQADYALAADDDPRTAQDEQEMGHET